jgi:DNA-binding NtrC family response regulator
MLCEGILDRVCSRHQRPLLSLSREALNEALAWPWPGNIRELENTLERAALLSQGLLIHHLRLPPLPSLPAPPAVPLPQPTPSVGGSVGRKGGAISNEEFREAMVRAEGDPGQVAVILGIHRRSVMRILARMSAHAP